MILFVSPKIDGMKTPQERLGIGYISSYLEENGYLSSIINLSYESMNDDEFISHVIYNRYKVVGFSIKQISQLEFLKRVGSKLKQLGIIIIVGGYIPTLSYKFVLRNYPFIDYLIRGEAEESMAYFAKHFNDSDLKLCPGLTYVEDGKIIKNNIPAPKENISNLPYPKRPYIGVQLKNGLSINMVSSRGCVNDCGFCAISTFYRLCKGENRWRGQSPEALFDEMKYYHKKYGVVHFNFVDNNFFGDFIKTKERAVRFAEILLRNNTKFNYRVSLRSDNIDSETIELLSRSGLKQVFIGIESLVPRQLKYYNKKITPEQNRHAVKVLKNHGVDFQIGLIWFDRDTTLDELKTNLEFTKTINPNNIHHFPNMILRFTDQTPLQKKVAKENYIKYEEERNTYHYGINDPIVRNIFEICDVWVEKYYQLYQLLIRLRFDYWNQDEEFCRISRNLYFKLKQAELDFLEDIIANGTKGYEDKIERNIPLFRELLKAGLVLYEKVIDKNGPLYIDFKVR
jgi:radical SAM superfamily enzyme YgiQ (UPF0313 family)